MLPNAALALPFLFFVSCLVSCGDDSGQATVGNNGGDGTTTRGPSQGVRGAACQKGNAPAAFGLALYTGYGPFAEGAPAGNVPEDKKNKANNCITPDGAECPQLCIQDSAPNNLVALRSTQNYPSNQFGDHAPTGDAINALVDRLSKDGGNILKDNRLRDSTGNGFVILLATDAGPDSCASVDPNNFTGNPAAYEKAEAAARSAFADFGVQVFALYVGEVGEERKDDRDFLNRVACLGVGETRDCAVGKADRFFEATDKAKLRQAVDEVVSKQAVSCVVALNGELVVPSGESCPSGGSLRLDSAQDDKDRDLQCGEAWRVIDRSTIETLGSACDDLKEPNTTLSGSFPCKSAKII